ncbi:uncharacterized protein I303_106288 [Kwoniella dejecticola CBS 10117]|uniref:Uncharacterized protein n=1 Tax=Kwoniella dejecticola CBS 10117 TaxID=1296121 RepID=A0A1A6A1T2_9TREE|nr:uncharacterized protein I303_06308 [Kwoniella dejecticola CBS 10117]OBR84021.1 hypothetical protein I303_06308 [Kwoniella dejecticola CBS 10117]
MSTHTQDDKQDVPRYLTIQELWDSWPMIKSPDREMWKYKGEYMLTEEGLPEKARALNKNTFPSQRTDYDLAGAIRLEWRHERWWLKLNVINVSVVSYAPRNGSYMPWPGHQHGVWSELWEKAHTDPEQDLTVSEKVELAFKMKEEANAENVILANMMSCAFVAARDESMKSDDMQTAYRLAIAAGQLLVEQRFGSTVRQLKKAFNKLDDLYKRQAGLPSDPLTDSVIQSQARFKRFNLDLKKTFDNRTDDDHRLEEEDYKLEKGRQHYAVHGFITERYPDEDTLAMENVIPQAM